MSEILQFWINGKSIKWIARQLSVTPEYVVDSINREWGSL